MMRARLTFSAALTAIFLAFAGTANAQAPVQDGTPPYEEEMNRLAEILGALHYLRELCGADEGQLWRGKMADLLTAEEPNATRKAKLIDSFNRGFRGFRNSYSSCTDSARFIVRRYMTEGEELSSRIAARYGN